MPNFPKNVTEEQVKELFGRHGEVTKVILLEQKLGQPKHDFGFVHYADHSNAIKAIEKTEKYVLEGKKKKKQRGQLFLGFLPRSSYF